MNEQSMSSEAVEVTLADASGPAMGGAETLLGNGAAAETGKEEESVREKPRASGLSRILGDIALLLMQSPGHRHMFLSDLEWLVMPPLLLGQCRIFYAKDRPMALALWASVSETVEKELEQGRARLKPNEWKSGDRLWLIELVTPGAAAGKPKVIDGLLAQLAKAAFDGKPFKATRMNTKTGRREVIEVGKKCDVNESNS